MNRKSLAKTLLLVVGFIMIGALSCPSAFARDRGRNRSHGREIIVTGHQRYHYRDGRFYRPTMFGFNFVVTKPPIGITVGFLPAGRRTIIVRGDTYYYYDNIYYKPCPSGYVVVEKPIVVAETTTGTTVTIHVPNSNGSFTPVTLVRHGDGYIGPQGEYYPNHPTVEQLKALYGK